MAPTVTHEPDRYGFQGDSVSCRLCGLGWRSPHLTLAAARAFYAEGMFDKLIRAHTGEPRSALEQADYARELVPWMSWGDKIWHIGDDRGVVNTILQAAWPKARIDTMDPSAGTGMLEDGAPGGPYDLILLPRTVEHLIHLRRCRQIIVDALKPGGRFFVDTLLHEWAGQNAVKFDHPWIFSAPSVLRFWSDGGLRLNAVARKGKHLWTLWSR